MNALAQFIFTTSSFPSRTSETKCHAQQSLLLMLAKSYGVVDES
jgi:hypothetical protein